MEGRQGAKADRWLEELIFEAQRVGTRTEPETESIFKQRATSTDGSSDEGIDCH